MADLLYLVHRVPYPPDKGDKVRSYHLLKHLAASHRVHLVAFADDPADLAHRAALRDLCVEVRIEPLFPRTARLASLRGLVSGEALSLPYYRNRRLARWVGDLARRVRFDATIVFSSVMAQYIPADPGRALLVDFVDVDSAKWTQYAERHTWPMSWLYRREGRCLLAFERAVAARATRSFFVTDAEVALFGRLAPECASLVEAIGNGVDADFFSPGIDTSTPFRADEIPVVFTGAMDYWPNIDAVTWFATEVVPVLRERFPTLRFHIVGRAPSPAVTALAGEGVAVSGSVPDVRPYLRHAAAVVAPLRVARGVQNKILEAMSMGQAVVASDACASGVRARPDADFLVAADAASFAAAVISLVCDPARAREIGAAARRVVVDHYSWQSHLAGIDAFLESASAGGRGREALSA